MRIAKSLLGNPLEALRKAGYAPSHDPVTGEDSFMCRFGADLYPRFHLYLQDQGDTMLFSLHLDQKKASYQGSSRHNGEYEGSHIEKELERLRGWIAHVHAGGSAIEEETRVHKTPLLQKKPWWKLW